MHGNEQEVYLSDIYFELFLTNKLQLVMVIDQLVIKIIDQTLYRV